MGTDGNLLVSETRSLRGIADKYQKTSRLSPVFPRFSRFRAEAQVEQVAGVKGDAEEVGGDKTELGGTDADDADDGTIEGGNNPALPELLANEDGGENGQHAGEIIEPDDVKYVKHSGKDVGSMRQRKLNKRCKDFDMGRSTSYTDGMEVKLSPELQAKLDSIAAQQGRDSASLVHEAVERLIGYDEWFMRQVEEGLAQIDRGEVLEHDEVAARMEKLIAEKQRRS
jgi:predicted transcriptional regulator